MAKATNQEAGLNDQQSPKDSDAPSRMVSTESLGSRADHIEQAVAILKRAHLAFTAALRYPELESNASLGCRPRSPQQNLQAFKDLEEDLVLQASAEVETLTREEWFEDIEINSTGCPPQRQEQVCGDNVWLPPRSPGFNFRHVFRGQNTLLEITKQVEVPDRPMFTNEVEVGHG